MARTGQPAVRQIESVQRAMAVLDALAGRSGPLGTNDLARRTGLNVSTVSRLLSTLTNGGLAAYDGQTGRYRLGPGLLRLAAVAGDGLDLRATARPHIEALAHQTGETATLSVPAATDAVTVDFVQSPRSVRSVAAVGRRSVAHATATGKVFLAWGGRAPARRLRAFTDRTITDRAELARDLTRVRRRGWARAHREREPDLAAIAAPVLGPDDGLIAILGVQGPADRLTARAATAAALALMRHAAELAAAHGG